MKLDDFINKYNNQTVDTDGAYGGQCMDLMHKYIVDVLGLDLALFAAPTAYESYKNANDSRFDKIANTPTGVPSKGDIMFWNTTVGSAGHVAVFISGDTNSFKSFDQNWPTGSKCHVQDHDYKGVAGWLHPKNLQPDTSIIDDLRKTRDDNWNLYEAEVSINNDLKMKNQDYLSKISSQAEALNNDAKLAEDLLTAHHVIDDFISKLGLPTGTSEAVALERITALQKPHDELVKNVVPVMNELGEAAVWKRSRKAKSLFDRVRDFFSKYVH